MLYDSKWHSFLPAHPTLELHVLDYPVVRVALRKKQIERASESAELANTSRQNLKQYLDLNTLAEIINGLPLKISHFHHPTILGSLQNVVNFDPGTEET